MHVYKQSQVVREKDAHGSQADANDTPVIRALKAIRRAIPELFVAVDVCLCEYTDHGHCGLLKKDKLDGQEVIDNSATLDRLARVARAYGEAGAHMVCPSDMMDGRVAAIRHALDSADLRHVMIMAYTSKKASSMYAPFRQAVDSTFTGNRKRYQHPIGSTSHAERALERTNDKEAYGCPGKDVAREVCTDNQPSYATTRRHRQCNGPDAGE